ncbi:hypothetical protein BDW74DRAFT_173191 [Aspergillus multicolor]|uniref:uncharacterized protein n=1 Tax=Aspergillus multicolor TaxID=41759 RepID=UPI003CCD1EB9
MTEILGAVAASDQLAGSFTVLYNNLSYVYRTIRYARKEVKEIETRTRTMKKLWSIFKQAMEDVSNIEESSIDFQRYHSFDRGLRKDAQSIIDRIQGILDILDPLLTPRKVSTLTDFRTRWV